MASIAPLPEPAPGEPGSVIPASAPAASVAPATSTSSLALAAAAASAVGASGAAVVTAATIEAQAIPGVTTIPPALAAAAVQAQSQFPELPFTVFSGPAAAQTADGASGGSVFAGDMTGADNVGQAHYASYGWYIVPSIGNDPGYADAAIETAGEWGFADAGYEGGDWFFLA